MNTTETTAPVTQAAKPNKVAPAFTLARLAKKRTSIQDKLDKLSEEMGKVDIEIQSVLKEMGLAPVAAPVKETPAPDFRKSTQSVKIYDLLKNHPNGLTCTEISRRTQISYANVYVALHREMNLFRQQEGEGANRLWQIIR